MTKQSQTPKRIPESHSGALPPWKIAAALLLATLAIAVIGWRITTAALGPPRPDLPVHAGMYDLRAELQKGQAVRGKP